MSLEDEVNQMLDTASSLTVLGQKFSAEGLVREWTTEQKEELLFDLVRQLGEIARRLAREIDRLSATIGEDDG